MLQLERVFFGCKSAVVFLRVKQARSNGVTAGSEKRNSATTRHVYWSPRQSYFFSPTPAQLPAIVPGKQSHYSLGRIWETCCATEMRDQITSARQSDYAARSLKYRPNTRTRFMRFYGTTWWSCPDAAQNPILTDGPVLRAGQIERTKLQGDD